jgi:hypothetical protein
MGKALRPEKYAEKQYGNAEKDERDDSCLA